MVAFRPESGYYGRPDDPAICRQAFTSGLALGVDQEFWLDGFNFFHQWEATRGLLRAGSGLDIVRALERSLRILSRHLGGRGGRTLVFLDGGLSWSETRLADLRVRWCGPGRKADDRMLSDLEGLGDSARRVIAVSNDRELRGGLKGFGAACLGVGEFLELIRGGEAKSGPIGRRDMPAAEVMRMKCRRLSGTEVNAWVDFFGGDLQA
ncbi:MAG: NYN domain-containing protein [Planctomycetota bacterium]|jgi:hypothetical protein|nr:NYN domain-containing protein [Planctomycetota bacterium]